MARKTFVQIEDDHRRSILEIEEAHKNEITRLEERLRSVVAENRDLREQIEGFKSQIEDLGRQIQDLNEEKAELQVQLAQQREISARSDGTCDAIQEVLNGVLEKVLCRALRSEDF